VEKAMSHRWNGSLAALILGLAVAAAPAWADPRPVVIELFTSQGCSSCPPADALLGELATKSEVLALGFHINYWDGLGWKDPLSSPSSTERQKAYARRLGDGRVEMVGSDREAVFDAVRAARPAAVAPISFAADRRSVAIGALAGGGAGTGEIVLVRFVQRRTTNVGAGENTGRIANDFNGVRTLTTLGAWDGSEQRFPVEPPAAGEGLAVIVQAPDGHMLGAALVLGSG
jgi:hypothetical protein